jgi:hypothetical protein
MKDVVQLFLTHATVFLTKYAVQVYVQLHNFNTHVNIDARLQVYLFNFECFPLRDRLLKILTNRLLHWYCQHRPRKSYLMLRQRMQTCDTSFYSSRHFFCAHYACRGRLSVICDYYTNNPLQRI